jgi:hypothetical protein
MLTDRTASTDTTAMAAEVEGLLDSAEPESLFRDTRECSGGLVLLGLLLSSPPSPRPKTETR